jgi:hypothetical protein
MRHLLAVYFAFSSACLAGNEPPSAYLPLCAELDLAAVSEMELIASTRQVPGDKIAIAFFQIMDARTACAEGRVSEALAAYDDISFD